MNKKIAYSIGLLFLVGIVFFGIYRQRVVEKSASIQRVVPTSIDTKVLNPTISTTENQTPILTNAGLSLTLNSPTNGQTVTTSQITVTGKTTPKAEIFINDLELSADANGNFLQIVSLEEGENYILIVANDTEGNFAEKELSITYEPA